MISKLLALTLSAAMAGLPAGGSLAEGTGAPVPALAPDVVRIYRDAKGVPHVFADTSAAVLFGAGYAMAHDRLAQLEMRRRSVAGTRAEILGPKAVEGDATARDRALPAAELMRMYSALPAEHQAMMQAFVDGINRYIAEVEAAPETRTPYEFRGWGVKPVRWTLLDFLAGVAAVPGDRGSEELHNAAFLEAMTVRYGPAVGREIFEDVVPLDDPDTPTVIPPGEDLAPAQPMPAPGDAFKPRVSGPQRAVAQRSFPLAAPREASRCLVIGPQRSASGHVLMMEATADGPEAQLHGGGFDTAGFSTTGWGPPIMGRSLQHGWLMTSGQADQTDIFEEKLNPADRHQYWFKGAWGTMEHRVEAIAVKGHAPVMHDVASTVHGPVISWRTKDGVAYAERYAERGHELDNWVAVVEMARAKTLAEFESKGIARVAWNLGICYGDTSGQFAFWEAGLLPKRAPGADSRLPTPGTGEYEWRGFLRVDERPHMLDPRQGFIHAWNSKATTWSREGDSARIGKTSRSWLETRFGETSTNVTLLDMQEVNRQTSNALGGTDRTQTNPDFFAPAFKRALAKTSDPEVAEAIRLMMSFNGLYEDMDKDGFYDSPGLPIFREWLKLAPGVVFSPTIGDWWSKVDEDRYLQYQTSLLLRALQGPDAGLPLKFDYLQGRDRDAVVIQTVKMAVDALKARYPGKPMSAWRLPIFWKYFDPTRRNAAQPEMPDPDAGGSLQAAVLGLAPYAVPHNGGDEWTGLMELDPKAPPKLYSVTNTGGQDLFIDPKGRGNPHLTDQIGLHADGLFKSVEMEPAAVQRDAESVQEMSYPPPPSHRP